MGRLGNCLLRRFSVRSDLAGVSPGDLLDSPLGTRGPEQHEPGHPPASTDAWLQKPERLRPASIAARARQSGT